MRIFLASLLITFLSPKIAASINTCSFFIIMDYDVWFIVKHSSVSSHLSIPYYGNFTFMTCFY
jgi:hypothetical protein